MIKKITILLFFIIFLSSCLNNNQTEEIETKSQIKKWDIVSLHFIGKIKETWEEFYNSYSMWSTLDFEVWAWMMIPWFEREIIWMMVWDKKTFNVKAEDAYWEYSEEYIEDLPRSELIEFEEAWFDLEVWFKLPTIYWEFEIVWVSEEFITLDLNHFLAWKDLTFEVEIVEINPKVEEVSFDEQNIINNNQYREMDTTYQLEELKNGDKVALISTNKWDIKIKLFYDEAPKTVINFMWHISQWYYDNVIFHRVIDWFMIQWWDPEWTWAWGESIYGWTFEDEFSDKLYNIRWSVSMANAWPNTNWSQFFINQVDNNFLDNKHSVFWQVIEWMDVVDEIIKVEVDSFSRPLEDVIILWAKNLEYMNWEFLDYELDLEEEIKKLMD